MSVIPELDWLPRAVCIVEAPAMDETSLSTAEAALIVQAVPRRRAHFAAGRACAHEALRRLGAPTPDLLRAESGAPLWPPGHVGSIAHCDAAAVAIVARDTDWRGLGIDVEPNRPLPDDVAGYALSIDERARLAQLPGGLAAWGLLAFCAKECVHKCLHPLRGSFLELDEVEIDIGIESASFQLRPLSDAGRSAFEGLNFTACWLRTPECIYALLAAV